jgi:hypothetical protein
VGITHRHSVVAMQVKQGNNYTKAVDDAHGVMISFLSDYTWLTSTGDEHVIVESYRNNSWYFLVQAKPGHDLRQTIERCRKQAKRCREQVQDHCTVILGSVVLGHVSGSNSLSEVSIMWLDPSMKGRGYGGGLLLLAYQQSKHGIHTSDNIGTEFLAAMWSMYLKEPEIVLVYDDKPLPRKGVVMKGTEVWYNNINLCDPDGPEFRFEWRK